jgi:hypothetical protein
VILVDIKLSYSKPRTPIRCSEKQSELPPSHPN